MTAPTCPGFYRLEGLCSNPIMPECNYCQRCEQERLAQLQASRTPQERGCEVLRWPHDDMGGMQ